MEWWNVEFNKEFISMLTFLTSLSKEILPVTHFSISPKPIIPSFHHSNCGAKRSYVPAWWLLIENLE